jgi:hypothetical protein
MPTPTQILDGLSAIANQWQMAAIVWHVFFAFLAVALALGIRPSKRTGGLLLVLPLFSVSVLAWISGNLFNGILFALAGIALLLVALRLPQEPVHIAPVWLVGVGTLLFVFGWVYPHFLETTSFAPYLYAAPTGLIPCPTLSIITALSLILGGLDSRAWSLILGGIGLFYGLFGAVRLGVTMDWVLFLGALLSVFVVYLSKAGIPKQEFATKTT